MLALRGINSALAKSLGVSNNVTLVSNVTSSFVVRRDQSTAAQNEGKFFRHSPVDLDQIAVLNFSCPGETQALLPFPEY